MSSDHTASHPRKSFRQFFFRGLGILLPTILTIWILVAVYNFVDQKIASPINEGVRWLVLKTSDYPSVTDAEVDAAAEGLTGEDRAQWVASGRPRAYLEYRARRADLEQRWDSIRIGAWAVMDLTGLVIAILLIYAVGRVLGGFLGRGVTVQGERLLLRVPLFKQVYPYVKQVTDFFVGEKDAKFQFNRVVAVQYPRKGLWSVGLVTGDTMRDIQRAAEDDCMTVFIPSSPTPFTGYVITVPKKDTVDLPITIDDALRFCVSGGVIVPEKQRIASPEQSAIEAKVSNAVAESSADVKPAMSQSRN